MKLYHGSPYKNLTELESNCYYELEEGWGIYLTDCPILAQQTALNGEVYELLVSNVSMLRCDSIDAIKDIFQNIEGLKNSIASIDLNEIYNNLVLNRNWQIITLPQNLSIMLQSIFNSDEIKEIEKDLYMYIHQHDLWQFKNKEGNNGFVLKRPIYPLD